LYLIRWSAVFVCGYNHSTQGLPRPMRLYRPTLLVCGI
jgi:hypothetical protein